MSNSAAATCIAKTSWLTSAALAVALLFPVSGVAAEWDIAIEGGYAPARESLSTQKSWLEASAGGVFVAGIGDEMTRTPAVVRYAPNSIIPAWTSMLGHAGGISSQYITTTKQLDAATDGSSLVYGSQLTRLDPDGQLQWAAYPEVPESVGTAAVLPDGDVLLVVDSPNSLWRHDGATGRLIASSNQFSCYARSMVVVDFATAYVSHGCGSTTANRVVQIDPTTLAVRWTYASAQVQTLRADASGVYLADGISSILKLSASNGALIWNFSRSPGLRMLGSGGNGDIVSAYDIGTASDPITRIERIDRNSGLALWARDVPGTFKTRVNGDAVVMTGAAMAVGGVLVPCVEVVDIDTGALAWHADIAVPTGAQVRITDAVANGSHIVVLGKQCPVPTGEARCEIAVWHLDRLSGGVAAVQPVLVQSGVVSDSKSAPDGKIWTAAIDWSSSGQRLRLFAHDAGTGATLVETEIAAPMSSLSAAQAAETVSLALNRDGGIAVLLRARAVALDAVAFKFDAAGAFVWRKSLLAGLSNQNGVTAELASIDATGNVLMGMQEFFGQPQPWTGFMQNRRWLLRLAAANGAVQWQREFRPAAPGLFMLNAPQAAPVGDDLVVREAPVDETWTGIARISGANGNVLWVNGDLVTPWLSLHAPSPPSLLAIGTVAPAPTLRIDPASGMTQWAAQYPYPGDQFYFSPWKLIESPIDKRYLLSTTRRTLTASGDKNGAFILSVNAQTGNLAWVNRFEPESSNRFERMDPIGVVGDRVYASGPSSSIANYVVGLMALNAATGTEGEVRTLIASTWRLPGEVPLGIGDAMKVVDGGILAQWPFRQQLGKAPGLSLARRDLGTQTAYGDIRVTLDWTSTTITGTPGTRITYTASNAGPNSAEDVRSIIDVPPYSPLIDVTCTINATPCSVDIGAAWIKGLHTIPAGADLVISARFANTANYASRSVFSASAVGPFRLVEPTLNDNFAESDFGSGDLILRNGFELLEGLDAAVGQTGQFGYVFPNVDSDGDGLPDGMERMYGLNRFNPDSDNDGCPDGVEFPVARVQQPGKDPLDPTLGGSCQ